MGVYHIKGISSIKGRRKFFNSSNYYTKDVKLLLLKNYNKCITDTKLRAEIYKNIFFIRFIYFLYLIIFYFHIHPIFIS